MNRWMRSRTRPEDCGSVWRHCADEWMGLHNCATGVGCAGCVWGHRCAGVPDFVGDHAGSAAGVAAGCVPATGLHGLTAVLLPPTLLAWSIRTTRARGPPPARVTVLAYAAAGVATAETQANSSRPFGVRGWRVVLRVGVAAKDWQRILERRCMCIAVTRSCSGPHCSGRLWGARPHTLCYAVKANSALAILRLLGKRGYGFDIVSGGELARVIAAAGDDAGAVVRARGVQRRGEDGAGDGCCALRGAF